MFQDIVLTHPSFLAAAMKASRPTLVLPNKSSSSPPQVTTITMDPIDPDRISQLSRRKLRGSASDKDNHNLRRLVLIQNSLVSISPIASPSRASPEHDEYVACSTDDELKSDRRFGEIGSGPPGSSIDDNDNDDDGFGYVFPDPSLWSGNGSGSGSSSSSSEDDDEDDEDAELVVVGESDWLDAVLSELDDEHDDEPQPISFHSPYSLRYQSHGSTRVPLPITPYHLPPSSESEDDPDHPPNFDDHDHDHDEGSSIYSDESLSEPATPLSHSLLRAAAAVASSNSNNTSNSIIKGGSIQTQPQRINVVSHSRHDFAHSSLADDEASPEDESPLSAGILPEIVVRESLKNTSYHRGGREGIAVTSSPSLSHHHHPQLQLQQHHQQQQNQNQNDYFSCHYFRGSYDSF